MPTPIEEYDLTEFMVFCTSIMKQSEEPLEKDFPDEKLRFDVFWRNYQLVFNTYFICKRVSFTPRQLVQSFVGMLEAIAEFKWYKDYWDKMEAEDLGPDDEMLLDLDTPNFEIIRKLDLQA